MIKEFLQLPVTQELMQGPNAPNISGTLGGVTNLFAFIGFDKDNPSIEQGYTLAVVQGPGTTLLMIVPFIIFLGYSLSSSRHKEIMNSLK